ncbi:cytidine deaminase [Mycoplasma sp. P36-A1]|uniref:cytidine deaminase n=1 Tax=Mycoplasma sp. P36-A1 TaxID=3252900 RepID=UPI003C2F86DA
MKEKLRETMFNLSMKGYANAYVPYSNYAVGASLVTKDNKAFIGANIENAAYGSTICAERTCINSAYANGVRKEDIYAFALVTESEEPGTPCGACRQVLSELLEPNTPIFIFNTKGDCFETDIATLLPYKFVLEAKDDDNEKNNEEVANV